MGFMDKVKDFVAPIEDEDEGYEATETVQPVVEEPVETQSRYERPKSRTNASTLSANTKMVLFEPRSFTEAEEVGQRLKKVVLLLLICINLTEIMHSVQLTF